MTRIGQLRDWFFGRGSASTTIPLMDGALKPNTDLDTTTNILPVPEVDDVACGKTGEILVTSGSKVLSVTSGKATLKAEYDSPITALAANAEGHLAVSLSGREIRISDDKNSDYVVKSFDGKPLRSVVALSYAQNGDLVVCEGSTEFDHQDWQHDLMMRGSSGRVFRLKSNGQENELLASGLAFPSGVLERDGIVYVSECWKHQILKLSSATGSVTGIGSPLPAYPSRLKPGPGGSICLSCFAPRSQLIELVLRQNTYRRRMMQELPVEHWIVPRFYSNRSYLEPLQGGTIKQLGLMKPWAPSLSYGLVILMDEDLLPLDSFHSRANGNYHGTTAAVSDNDTLFVASKGSETLFQIPISGGTPCLPS